MRKIFTIFVLAAMSILYMVAPSEGQEVKKIDNYFGVLAQNNISEQDNDILTDTSLELGTKKYTNTNVKMREEKSVKSEVVTTLEPNVEIIVYVSYKGWSYVSVDGDTYGYIKTKYISKKPTPVRELNRWGIELTKDEINLLAKIVFREANLEGYKGQVAVVECIFNRIYDGYWGESLYEVLSAKGQFTSWKSRNGAKPTSQNYQAINDVLLGKTEVIGIKYLYFSRGGHAKHSGMIKIGNHQFCTK